MCNGRTCIDKYVLHTVYIWTGMHCACCVLSAFVHGMGTERYVYITDPYALDISSDSD